MQVTVSEHACELLEYARALLGHAVPSGDVSQVLERALEALVERLEKQKFAKTSRMVPRRSSSSADDHYLPARVRRTVWQRDGGQCTFVSDQGKRCEARSRLEFDHVEPVARGGQTCVAGLRLRCRAHNQYTAECTFGAGFMNEKREASRHKAMQAKQQAERQAP
ncbi:MAG TPA: hypothetical protein VFP36_13275 [Usitatibacter sp.]|nr:hypothetical protein [Usitatibacter sp.]